MPLLLGAANVSRETFAEHCRAIMVCDTPVDLPGEPVLPVLPVLAENSISIDAADRLFWNGATVTTDALRTQVAAASSLEHEPLLRFEPDALASYDTAARTIVLIKEEGAAGFAFVGDVKHRNFG